VPVYLVLAEALGFLLRRRSGVCPSDVDEDASGYHLCTLLLCLVLIAGGGMAPRTVSAILSTRCRPEKCC